MKRIFSILGKKNAPEVPAAGPGESSTFLTGENRIDSRNVKLLLDTMAELISDQESGALVRKIVDRAIESVRAERGILFLREPDGSLSIAVARDSARNSLENPRHSTTVVRQVFETGQGLCLKIGDSDTTNDLSASVVDLKLRAVMCVRLRFQQKILGVIYVDSRVTNREFSQKDLRFFDALGVALSITLENARLIEAALERQRLRNAMEVAQEIAHGLQPDDPRGLHGFDIAGSSTPAEGVPGDYYDFIPGRPGELGIVVGDVTGHGVGPAMLMAGARSALRVLFEYDLSEAEILARLNQRLAEDLADDMFMSMVVCRLNVRERRLQYANAGQPAPLVLRAGGELLLLQEGGLALGIEAGFSFENHAPVDLGSGDAAVIFTDGIVETRSAAGEQFGTGGIARVLREHPGASAAELLRHLHAAARAFSGKEALEDDITLVVIKAT